MHKFHPSLWMCEQPVYIVLSVRRFENANVWLNGFLERLSGSVNRESSSPVMLNSKRSTKDAPIPNVAASLLTVDLRNNRKQLRFSSPIFRINRKVHRDACGSHWQHLQSYERKFPLTLQTRRALRWCEFSTSEIKIDIKMIRKCMGN